MNLRAKTRSIAVEILATRCRGWDCINGSAHADCWNACAERSADDIELFGACVENTVPSCDRFCLIELLDASEPEPEPSGCAAVCQAYLDAGCEVVLFEELVSCELACAAATPEEHAAVEFCLDDAPTCSINPLCTDE